VIGVRGGFDGGGLWKKPGYMWANQNQVNKENHVFVKVPSKLKGSENSLVGADRWKKG